MRSSVLAILAASLLFADVNSIRELIRGGRLAEAIAQSDRELKANPRSAALLTLKGLALQASGDSSALTVFRQALAIEPAALAALQATAQLEFAARDPLARRTLEALLRQAPATTAARAMLATLLFEARDCEAALPHLAALPPEPAIRWQHGVCLFELRQWAGAATHFAALLKLREHPPTRFNLALAQWQLKDYRATIATLEPMPPDVDALRLQAAALEASGQVPQALTLLQKAIDRFPQDERFLADLAVLCMDHNAGPLGVEVLTAGLERHPSSASLRTLLGVLYVRSGQAEQGEAAFRGAEQLSPVGRIGLASLLMQLARPGDAADLLRPQLASRDARVIVTYARALLQKYPTTAESGELLALLQGVVERDPRDGVAHGLLGKLLAQRGDAVSAARALARAIELDPADRAATYQLMSIYQRQGRTREASALAAKIRTLIDGEKQAEQSRFALVRHQP